MRLDVSRVLTFPSSLLNRYIKNAFPRIGRAFKSDFVALHSWSKGVVELTEAEAQAIAGVRQGNAAELDGQLVSRLPKSFLDTTPDIDGVVDRAVVNFGSIQHYAELREFLARTAGRRPGTVVEIGTARGGLFFALCQMAVADATLVSIDIGEGGPFGGGQSDEECTLFRCFGWGSQDIRFVRGSSFAISSVRSLENILGGRKVDLLFIDGNHNYGAVKSDFEMYRHFLAPDGWAVLHDIMIKPDTHGTGMDVGVFWEELKKDHPVQEIISETGARSDEQRQGRFSEFEAEHPQLTQWAQQQGMTYDDLFAIGMKSEFVQYAGPLQELAAVFRSAAAIPDRIQMAWGIGIVPAGRR